MVRVRITVRVKACTRSAISFLVAGSFAAAYPIGVKNMVCARVRFWVERPGP